MFKSKKGEIKMESQNAPKKESKAIGKAQKNHGSKPKRVAKLIYQFPTFTPQIFQPVPVMEQPVMPPPYIKPPPQKIHKNKQNDRQKEIIEVPKLIKEEKVDKRMPAIPCFDIVKRGNLPCISFWHDKVDVIYFDDYPTVNIC